MPNTSGIHILSELFVVLGYFALNNPDNQVRPVPIWQLMRSNTSDFEGAVPAKQVKCRVLSCVEFDLFCQTSCFS